MDAVALDRRLSPNQRLSPSLDDRLSRHGRLLIDGQWVEAASGKTFPVYDPSTGTIVAQVAEGDAEDINRAVVAARHAFEHGPWARTTPRDRAAMLWKLADLIDDHAEELAQLESLDNGKPIAAARAADVPLTSDQFRYMAGWATKITGRTSEISLPGEWLAYTRREPIGVVGGIIPWNFPLLLCAWKIAPALAAGNTIVLKPAEQTPLTSLFLGELIQQAGIPDGVVNIITGFGETAGAALSAHMDVDKVAFTGSTEVGRLIARAATGNMKKVTLELGGKSPVVVFPDADMSKAIPGASGAIFFNAGQVCCAGSRIFAHKKVFDELVDGIAQAAKKIKVGDGLDPTTEMGPLVSEEQFQRVTGFLKAGSSEGATVKTGGGKHGTNGGYFVEPTVLTDVKNDMKVVREEIFGPVLVAQSFGDDDVERIVREANDTRFGLAASVWTRDHSLATRVAHKLRAGTVWVNCHHVFDVAQPFGGYKESGWGRECGEDILHAYTETKSVTAAL